MAYFLGEMTADAVKKVYEIADYIVLPVGSNEQHSYHLPFLSDSIQAEGIARALAIEGMRKGLTLGVLPVLPFGYSEEHWNYPGTISLSPETYLHVILDIATCLKRHKAKRMLIINGHYSNMPILSLAVDRVLRDIELPCHLFMWTKYLREGDVPEREDQKGHGGYIEACMDLYFADRLVKMTRAKKPHVNWNRDSTIGWWGGTYFEELTDTGALGDATGATAKLGKKVVEITVPRMIKSLLVDAGKIKRWHK